MTCNFSKVQLKYFYKIWIVFHKRHEKNNNNNTKEITSHKTERIITLSQTKHIKIRNHTEQGIFISGSSLMLTPVEL